MIGPFKNDQKLQVSVHPVMRRRLPPSAHRCSPPGHLFCTTVGEITGLVSDRDDKDFLLTVPPGRTCCTVLIQSEQWIFCRLKA